MAAFEESVSPLHDRIMKNDKETQTFASLRDTLLPKLISGELRLTDAKRFLERSRV